MKRILLIGVACASLLAQDTNGIPPRKSATDYPANETSRGSTLAAALLSPVEAKRVFVADLDRAGYLVFEVAMYPVKDGQVDISPDQFTLRTGSTGSVLPTVSPESIVESMYHSKPSGIPKLPGGLDVHTSTTIGYETGGGYPRRNGGVYAGTATTVGVGSAGPNGPGPPPPPATVGKPDRDTLFAELTAREFPNTKATAPIAGYLYFAKPQSKPKNGMYELTCTLMGLSGENIVLSVPTPGKK
jgi:hypothetical protein